MNFKAALSGNISERKAFSHQAKVKILLALILVVSFQHMFEVVQYFTTGWTGTLSNIALVIWIDLMMFFCLDLIGKKTETRARRGMGWIVFGFAASISGFLNVYYFMHQKPAGMNDEIKEIISLMLGGLPPIAVIFLGMVYSDSENIIIKTESQRIAESDKPERVQKPRIESDSMHRKGERDDQIIGLYKSNVSIREIERQTGISRPTIRTVLKKNDLLSSNEVED